MALLLRGAGTATSASPISITKPAGTAQGDIIIIRCVVDGAGVANTPTGFALLHSNQSHASDTLGYQSFWKEAGASEPASYSVSGTFGTDCDVTIEVYYDNVGGGTWNVGTPIVDNTTISGTQSLGPLSCSAGLLLFSCCIDDSATVSTPPTGMTLATNAAGATTTELYNYYEILGGSGNETRSITWSLADATIASMVNITYGSAAPSLDSVDTDDTVAVGDTEPATYSNFTTGIETATINDGGTAATSLTVSNVTGTSADLQLASLAAWVNTKACPFTSANQTSQQVTVTSTDEDPDEVASLAVTFNPPSGYFVTELTSNTWPAPDGSIYKGFTSQPPIGMQFIHNLDLLGANGVSPVDGIVTTDVSTNQTVHAWNPATEEGSSFQWLIESGGFAGPVVRGIIRGIQRGINKGIK